MTPSITIQSFTSALPLHARPLAADLFCVARLHGIDPCLLAAVCERESNYGRALDAALTGDRGHGRGLMQIDDRAHSPWLIDHDWRDPRINLSKGAEILNEALSFFAKRDDVPDVFRESAGVAAYNAGPMAVLRTMRAGNHPDSVTTGREYSADVFRRQARIAAKFAQPQVMP